MTRFYRRTLHQPLISPNWTLENLSQFDSVESTDANVCRFGLSGWLLRECYLEPVLGIVYFASGFAKSGARMTQAGLCFRQSVGRKTATCRGAD